MILLISQIIVGKSAMPKSIATSLQSSHEQREYYYIVTYTRSIGSIPYLSCRTVGRTSGIHEPAGPACRLFSPIYYLFLYGLRSWLPRIFAKIAQLQERLSPNVTFCPGLDPPSTEVTIMDGFTCILAGTA